MPSSTPDFRRMVAAAHDGLVVLPALQAYLARGKFPRSLKVSFEQHSLDSGPDGHFHPSNHPLMTARQLWYYLHYPEYMEPREFGWMGMLSVMMGKAYHSFIQACMRDANLTMTPTELEREGWTLTRSGECYLQDPETGSRGQCDGILKVMVRTADRSIWEFKTSNSMTIRSVSDLDLDAFIAKWPDYYAQVQEYMRLSGLSMAVVTILALGYPWEMREFHIPADPQFQASVAEKYLAARADEIPPACCMPTSKESRACPARRICPVALV